MKVTVVELDAARLDAQWVKLGEHIQAQGSELLLLPEMCFSVWFCAVRDRDEGRWQEVVRSHDHWLARLGELGAKAVIGTAPRNLDNKSCNIAYLWTAENELRWIHGKTYLPNDDGYWEANWYDRAPVDFRAVDVGGIRIGAMICTEIWFMQHAREYGRQGIHLLVNPRSTPASTQAKWLAGGQSAAVVAGAYCLSSNHAGRAGQARLGGGGWICDPDGAALAVTTADRPFITLDLDLSYAEAAKNTYPRYVDDSPL